MESGAVAPLKGPGHRPARDELAYRAKKVYAEDAPSLRLPGLLLSNVKT
jgi:hypothetical protein